jgi:serine protease AprX
MIRHTSAFTLFFYGATAIYAGHKLAKDLENVDPQSTVDVIIQYNQAPTAAHHAKIRARGGQHKRDLSVIKGGHYSVPAAALTALENDPDVVAISPDRAVHSMLDLAGQAVNAPAAWNLGYTGTGIGIAIIDSGVDLHYDLKLSKTARIVYNQSFVPGSSTTADEYGHGTHVAVVAAGNGWASACGTCTKKLSGIAPTASVINLRVLDQNGAGTDSAVIAAIQKAIALKSTYNIRVINLSLGRPVAVSYTADPLCQAVEAAWKAGIVVVVAAGNEGRNNSANTNGYGTITAPGNDPYVITVGAMKTMGTPGRGDDLIASYSSRGPTLLDHVVKPDLVAPGNRIDSALANNGVLPALYPGNVLPQSYFNPGATVSSVYYALSGTSMAAPMVSGAVADLLEKSPSLTPDQVKARLMKTAYKTFPVTSTTTDPVTGISYTSQYDMFTVGAGYLDVAAALTDTSTAAGSALSPTVKLDPVTHLVSLVFGSGVVWGSGLVWGTGVVWGSGVIWGTGIVWGTGVVWGTGGVPSGTSVIWGSGMVWGTGSPAGEAATIAINGEN